MESVIKRLLLFLLCAGVLSAKVNPALLVPFSGAVPAAGSTPVTWVQSVGGTNTGGGATAATAYGSNVTAGNLLIVLVQWRAGSLGNSISSISDTRGNSYTINVASKSAGASSSATELGTQIAYCTANGSGANTVTVTFAATTQSSLVSLIETTAGQFDQVSTGTGSGTTVNAGTITTGSNGSFGAVVANYDDGVGAGTGWAAGGSFTLFQNTGGGNWEWGAEYYAQPSAGALAGTMTLVAHSSNTYYSSFITFKP